jgi:hypothetical protein
MSGSEWTDETDAEAVAFFDTLSTSEIRKRQRLCAEQKTHAYARRLMSAMKDLDRMETALTNAMLRKCR